MEIFQHKKISESGFKMPPFVDIYRGKNKFTESKDTSKVASTLKEIKYKDENGKTKTAMVPEHMKVVCQNNRVSIDAIDECILPDNRISIDSLLDLYLQTDYHRYSDNFPSEWSGSDKLSLSDTISMSSTDSTYSVHSTEFIYSISSQMSNIFKGFNSRK
jgi:hypothetical protein